MHHYRRRIFSVVVVVLVTAALIWGSIAAGGVVDGAPKESTFSWLSNKDTIYFWYADDALTNYINSAAVTFSEESDVRVIPVLVDEGQYLETINEATLHSDKMPDAFLLSNESLERAYLAGLASEIRDPEGICGQEHYPKAALNAVTYKGKLAAWPFYYETAAMVYNADYMDEWARAQRDNGVDDQMGASEMDMTGEEFAEEIYEGDYGEEDEDSEEEDVPAIPLDSALKDVTMTLDHFLRIADSFDAPQGVEAFMRWDVSDILFNYWALGKSLVIGGACGDDRAFINIDNPDVVNRLEAYQDLNQFFYIEPDSVDYESSLQDFIEGRIVFTIVKTGAVERLNEARESGELIFDYGFTQIPDVSDTLKSSCLSVTGTVAVNGYSTQKDAANRFAAYLTEGYAEHLYEKSGKVSVCSDITESVEGLDIFAREYAESTPLQKIMGVGDLWMQLESMFAKLWEGENAADLVTELDEQVRGRLNY